MLETRYPAAHFVEEVKQFILDDPRFGDSARERRQLLFTGGLRIHTTIDLGLQALAEQAVAEVLPDPATQPAGSLVAVDPGTGYVRAMVGGRDFFGAGAEAKYNLAMGKGRQTGSSFKPIVLAAAIEDGITLDQPVLGARDDPAHLRQPAAHLGRRQLRRGRARGPGVAVGRHARLLQHGVRAADPRGRPRTGHRDGPRHGHHARELDAFPSAVLGTNDVQTLEMASVYGTLANRGVHVDPVMVTSIERADGTIVYEAEHHQQRAMSTRRPPTR